MAAYTKLLFFLLYPTFCRALTIQSLNGQWTATSADPAITIPEATVPGGIFSDLMNNGNIDDIFSGNGDSDYSWVGTTDWTYTTTITVDEALLATRVIQLIFEGLDTFATILVNGVEVGTSENMFVRYVFSIKDQLQVGSNEISVQFVSSVNKAAALAEDPNNTYVIPPECPSPEQHGICHVNRIRKMQASYSWDWGPAFASVGIWKDVSLRAFDNAVIDYLVAVPYKSPDTPDVWTIAITVYINGGEIGPISGFFNTTLHLPNETLSVSMEIEPSLTRDVQITAYTSIEVPIESVNPWWPNGYGTQDLYDVSALFAGETEQDEKTVRVGFRTVELVQEELEHGATFYFKVNDQPIFAKGANEIPINILPEKGQDPATIRNVLQSARDVHMNMIRVWGGGVYESDYFYDLADEYGILIWQDFMFACALYPVDDAFLTNVIEEVRHQARRLGGHPSIAIWAGNNENEAALAQNWYGSADNFTLYKEDYIKLYVDVIEAEVQQILPYSNYITSSPTNGLETDQEDYVAANPGDPEYGDVHFYDYGSDSWNPLTFPIARFASKFGYQSLPSVESWLTATDSLDNIKPDSTFLEYRQHHPGGNPQNVDLISLQLQLPDASSGNYAAVFVYFSQILQAQSIKTEVEHYRSFKGRLNEAGLGNTMGALYWQLNDVWVAPTWSGIDYTGRWKMLHYQAQDFYNPLIITGRLSADDTLEVYAILDALEVPDVSVQALIHVFSWDSLEPLLSVEVPVTLDPLKSVPVIEISAATALSTAGCGSDYSVAKTNCFFHLELIDQGNNQLVPFNYVFPEKLKNSNLADATVEISSVTAVGTASTDFEIVVTTDVIALFVWLDSHDVRGRFSENGFLHVLPSKTVYFTADQPIALEDLTAALTITHLRDPANL